MICQATITDLDTITQDSFDFARVNDDANQRKPVALGFSKLILVEPENTICALAAYECKGEMNVLCVADHFAGTRSFRSVGSLPLPRERQMQMRKGGSNKKERRKRGKRKKKESSK